MIFSRKSVFFFLSISLVILLHIWEVPILNAQIEHILEGKYYVPDHEIPTFEIEQDGLTAEYPDWRQISFSRLQGIAEDGEILSQPDWDRAVGYSLSRFWNAGDSPAQMLKLGDFPNSLVEGLNLEYILGNTLTEIDLEEIPLSALELIKSQTIESLVKAIPGLERMKVEDVAPILELVGQGYANRKIGNLINTRLGDLSFDKLDLEDFKLSDIPGILEAPLEDFKDWQNSFLDQVPGLWDLPLNFLFGNGIFTAGLLGMADLALGTAEGGIGNTISGSYEEGFNVPCESECAHVELGNWALGKRWISGKYQKVKGGSGILKWFKGGKEPTGRHPFGSWAKVVVWDVDESEGRVDTRLFERFCATVFGVNLGCTPYVFGPFPFLSYHEKDTMIIGLLDGSGGSTDTNPIPVPPEQKQPLPPENAGGLINPLPDSIVTSEYGYRQVRNKDGSILKDASTFHAAIDLAYSTNDPRHPGQIIASGSGIVRRARPDSSGCGTLIIIDHQNGLRTGYCHMSTIYVKQNEPVTQGQVIAQVGNEGTSTAPHLHFMIYENGKKINPRKYVDF